jgi:hypothetical protein
MRRLDIEPTRRLENSRGFGDEMRRVLKMLDDMHARDSVKGRIVPRQPVGFEIRSLEFRPSWIILR